MPKFLFDKSKPIRLELDRQAVAVSEEQVIREQGSNDENGTQGEQSKRIKDGLLYVPEFDDNILSNNPVKIRIFDGGLKKNIQTNTYEHLDFAKWGTPFSNAFDLQFTDDDYQSFLNLFISTPTNEWKNIYKVIDQSYHLHLDADEGIVYPADLKENEANWTEFPVDKLEWKWRNGTWKFLKSKAKKLQTPYLNQEITKITATADSNAPTVLFKLNKTTDIFIIPRLVYLSPFVYDFYHTGPGSYTKTQGGLGTMSSYYRGDSNSAQYQPVVFAERRDYGLIEDANYFNFYEDPFIDTSTGNELIRRSLSKNYMEQWINTYLNLPKDSNKKMIKASMQDAAAPVLQAPTAGFPSPYIQRYTFLLRKRAFNFRTNAKLNLICVFVQGGKTYYAWGDRSIYSNLQVVKNPYDAAPNVPPGDFRTRLNYNLYVSGNDLQNKKYKTLSSNQSSTEVQYYVTPDGASGDASTEGSTLINTYHE